jgi:hypothetical protein
VKTEPALVLCVAEGIRACERKAGAAQEREVVRVPDAQTLAMRAFLAFFLADFQFAMLQVWGVMQGRSGSPNAAVSLEGCFGRTNSCTLQSRVGEWCEKGQEASESVIVSN